MGEVRLWLSNPSRQLRWAGGLGTESEVWLGTATGSTFDRTTTISLKLPENLLRELEQEAAARGVPRSAVIRDSIERTLRHGRKAKKKLSCLDLMGDLVGSLEGPSDASTNAAYLDEAVLANQERAFDSQKISRDTPVTARTFRALPDALAEIKASRPGLDAVGGLICQSGWRRSRPQLLPRVALGGSRHESDVQIENRFGIDSVRAAEDDFAGWADYE